MNKMSYVVNGFLFVSKTDYERALKEKNNIDALKKKIDTNDREDVYKLFVKLVSKNYFVTPVGISFLYELREYLLEDYEEDKLPNIPVSKLGYSGKSVEKHVSDRQFAKLRADNDKLMHIRDKLTIVVIALVVIVIGMFVIMLTNENVGYFNAEEKILDKYSAWEEELDAREEELNAREKELDEIEKIPDNELEE